ncbi:MAG: ABC transporter permease [Defluviitaleaceae bacterium]|nr:ABC transporter permease [Defluviitaleaceae bacterium]
MNNFKNILEFEYGRAIKSKSFIITNLILAIIGVAAVFIPNIIAFFGGEETENISELSNIAIVDNTGIFTDNILASHLNANFSRNYTNLDELLEAIEYGNYNLGIYFIGERDYILVFENSLAGPAYTNDIENMVREIYVLNEFGEAAVDILNVYVNANFIPVGGAGFLVGHIFNTLIMITLAFGASAISMSIINEKTSKVVEILFTSTTPQIIVTAKVTAGILIMFTKIALIILPFIIAMILTESEILNFLSPEVLATLLDPINYIYIFIIFLVAFVSYSFLYACLSAMVNDASEAGNVQMLPTMLLMGSYYLGIIVAGNTSWVSDSVLTIASFFPFISPLILIVRITSLGMETGLLILAILANIIYMALTILLSIKIYTKYISSKGENPLKKLLKMKSA